jgi:hypothetical protein
MKRREFCKSIALVPATGALASFPSLAKVMKIVVDHGNAFNAGI